MSAEENLKLLGLFLQCSYKLKIQEKKRGQGRLLVLLENKGPLTQKALVDLTGRKSATLSEQLGSMEKSGLIIREKDAEDKRNRRVELTPAGQKAAMHVREKRLDYANELFNFLTDESRKTLISELEALVQAWGMPLNEEEYEDVRDNGNK